MCNAPGLDDFDGEDLPARSQSIRTPTPAPTAIDA
jgi:hypothetical protein